MLLVTYGRRLKVPFPYRRRVQQGTDGLSPEEKTVY